MAEITKDELLGLMLQQPGITFEQLADKILARLNPRPGDYPSDLQVGDFVRVVGYECVGVDDDGEEVLVPAGSIAEVTRVGDHGPPQGRFVEITFPNGVTNSFDEADTSFRFPFELVAAHWFNVELEAPATARTWLNIKAPSEDYARTLARLRVENGIVWDQADVADEAQAEIVSVRPGR